MRAHDAWQHDWRASTFLYNAWSLYFLSDSEEVNKLYLFMYRKHDSSNNITDDGKEIKYALPESLHFVCDLINERLSHSLVATH